MTSTTAIRRLPQALAVCAIISGIAVWAVTAAPAGASASFDSPLSATTVVQKFNVGRTAPYTESAAVKRATAVPRVKTSKRLSVAPGSAPVVVNTTSTNELATARSILAQKIARYPILKGTTVEFGDARGYQAIAYYTSGRIVISRTHTASLDRIISHEIWHVIDWRDNGRIDWGESVPPR